ncbi:MAG: segregation and condensation protein A [Gammaproteobacteria bacterium]|nr:segregation and condensation protein A [Gammaproteobacteria bacterium]
MSNNKLSNEERILRIMRKVLTDVAKDTYTKPGLKHPLTEDTIISIRDCLSLISAREQEILKETGRSPDKRPRFVDEPQTSVVVPLHRTDLGKKPTDR